MNLKDAFRYEKFLTRLFNEGVFRLEERPTAVLYCHKRHAAYPKHQDESLWEKGSDICFDNDVLLDFLLYVLERKRALGEAIRRAKNDAAVTLDAEMQINAMRRRLYEGLQTMLSSRPRNVMCFGDGVGYYLAEDGTQKEYHYDIEKQTVLTFNRQRFGEKATALIRKAETVSSAIERQLLLVQVDFDPLFEVHLNLQEAYEQFAERSKAAG